MIQITKIQATKFIINKTVYDFVRPNYLMKDFGVLIPAKIKGSCLGWHVEGGWVSYNQLREITKLN